ncbi:MAG: hypothetical protein LC796_05670 [Acidobacteria bacterium]|nr:hypothetical protein [Acidobacteriota bacterium]MCA1612267.1 hypothetical protein [Acidobacteriota bacterium]
MTLAAGTRLGPYEFLVPLGAGGMGDVYKARDTRLERDVAIKVLAHNLSSSAEVRQRFERASGSASVSPSRYSMTRYSDSPSYDPGRFNTVLDSFLQAELPKKSR